MRKTPVSAAIALIPRLPADTVPRACRPLAKTESDDGLHTRPHAPGTLVPGLHSCSAAVLGRSGLRDPAAVRYGDGSGHFSSRNHAARARAETVEGRLCAAFAPADGRPLRRKSKSAAALLSVPGDHQAIAARPPGAVSQIAGGNWDRLRAARHPLCRGRLGKPDARRVGVGLGMLVRRHGGVAVHLFPSCRPSRNTPGTISSTPTR